MSESIVKSKLRNLIMLVIESQDADFSLTGLKVSSTVRLHRLMTVSSRIITRELGELSKNQQTKIENRLRKLFGI